MGYTDYKKKYNISQAKMSLFLDSPLHPNTEDRHFVIHGNLFKLQVHTRLK